MACANLTCIYAVIPKIIISYSAILEANQAIARNYFGIEIHLHLGIHRNGLKCASDLVKEKASCLWHVVHVGLETVTVIG